MSKEKLLGLGVQKDVHIILTRLVAHEAVKRGGLRVHVSTCTVFVSAADALTKDYGSTWGIADGLLLGAEVDDAVIVGLLDKLWELVEKAPGLEHPKRRLIHQGEGDDLSVRWIIPGSMTEKPEGRAVLVNLAKVPDQRGVLSLVNALLGRVVRRAGGLSFTIGGQAFTVQAEWWLKGYREVWRLAEALLAGEAVTDVTGLTFTTHLKTLEGALTDALALIEKAPELKYPRKDRVLAHHHDGTEINGVPTPFHVWWMAPIPPGERDTNMTGEMSHGLHSRLSPEKDPPS